MYVLPSHFRNFTQLDIILPNDSSNFEVFGSKNINPLPDMPILGFSNSAANKDMMSKILTNRDTVI